MNSKYLLEVVLNDYTTNYRKFSSDLPVSEVSEEITKRIVDNPEIRAFTLSTYEEISHLRKTFTEDMSADNMIMGLNEIRKIFNVKD